MMSTKRVKPSNTEEEDLTIEKAFRAVCWNLFR